MTCALTVMATSCREHGSKVVRHQHDWMIQTWENGKWCDYWGISTYTANRRYATAKARRSISPAYLKGRWRLVFMGTRTIGFDMTVPACYN